MPLESSLQGRVPFRYLQGSAGPLCVLLDRPNDERKRSTRSLLQLTVEAGPTISWHEQSKETGTPAFAGSEGGRAQSYG